MHRVLFFSLISVLISLFCVQGRPATNLQGMGFDFLQIWIKTLLIINVARAVESEHLLKTGQKTNNPEHGGSLLLNN